MAPLISTYNHDYIHPIEMKRRLLIAQNLGIDAPPESDLLQPAKICTCDPPDPLEELNFRAGARPETRGHSEWTCVAPSDKLIRTRIIRGATGGHERGDSSAKRSACFADKPNRFLQNLCHTYPKLYAELELASSDGTGQMSDGRRLSTYQVDYGRMPEYPMGTYDGAVEVRDDDEAERFGTFRVRDPCCEDAVFPDRRVKSVLKVCQTRKRADVCAVMCPETWGHWHAEKKRLPAFECQLPCPVDGMVYGRCVPECCAPKKCKHMIMYSLLTKKY